jgi:hypothetical protein
MQTMRQLKLLMLAMLSVLAFGAVATAVASAEDGQPALLTEGGAATALQGTFAGTGSTLSTLGGKVITGTGITATIAGCTALEGKEKDTNNCAKTTVDFTGVTSSGSGCRSENAKAEKDPIETVLTLLVTRAAAGLKVTELSPLVIFTVLGIAGESELTIVCGVLKDKVRGLIACLLAPGLTQVAAKGKFEVLCKTSKVLGDPEEEECTQTAAICKELKEKPFESNLGAGFEMASMLAHLEGSFNLGVFVDD